MKAEKEFVSGIFHFSNLVRVSSMPPLSENGFLGRELDQWIQMIREVHAAVFSLADEVNRYCQSAMYQLSPHNKLKQEVLVSTLFIRVLCNYQASILLAERGMIPQSKVLARVTIEALFKLCAISKSEKYTDEFILDDYRSRLNYLNKFRELHGGALPPDVDKEEVESLEQELRDEISNGEVKNKTTVQWSKDADMHDWYLSVYPVLSESVHTKVKGLEEYLVLNAQQEITELRCGPEDHGIESILITLIQSMLIAVNCTHCVFEDNHDPQTTSYQERLDALIKERLLVNG